MKTDLLIIGAGPFGLAVAARAGHLGIDHLIVGMRMEFWQRNMPKGMYLRSACDWHLDPQGTHTIEKFVSEGGKTTREVEPISLEFYLSYVDWFCERKQIHPLPAYISELTWNGKQFVARTNDHETIIARRVVLAPGFKHFAHFPSELESRLPPGYFEHTITFVDFSSAANRRFLIVGGRQSAFEWAALLLEAGAGAVHLTHRHASPEFAVSEWAWVTPIVDKIANDPSWYRELTPAEQDQLAKRLWSEGRLKLEPWLEPRLASERIRISPNTKVIEAIVNDDDSVTITLSDGQSFPVDKIVLATGYKVDIQKLPLVASPTIAERLEIRNGFPVLDEHLQTSVPGLFITSMPASQDFGPFFGFTISVRTSAKLICEACND